MRLGLVDHFGWAVAVTSDADHAVVDRRRVELVEPGLSPAPIHYDRGESGLDEVVALVAAVRASVARCAAAALDEIEAIAGAPLTSLSLRTWPPDFPADVEVQRRTPYEARADAVMYRQVLAEVAGERGVAVHLFDARTAEAQAALFLGSRAEPVLRGPRASLGPPWAKDHRTALAATILAGRG